MNLQALIKYFLSSNNTLMNATCKNNPQIYYSFYKSTRGSLSYSIWDLGPGKFKRLKRDFTFTEMNSRGWEVSHEVQGNI